MWRKFRRRVIDGRRESVVKKLEKNPRRFRSFFGVNAREFHKLYDMVEPVMVRQSWRDHRIRNVRKYGAGRIHECPLIDRLGMSLMLTRGHSEEVTGEVFDVSRDTARVTIDDVNRALEKCLDTPERITWKFIYRRDSADLRKYTQPSKAALDASVFPVTKPPDRDTFLRLFRRGKGLGYNIQTVVTYGGYVVFASDAIPASVSDAELYRLAVTKPLLEVFEQLFVDRAYIGVNEDPDVSLIHGDKKPPGGKLSEESLAKNAWINHEKYKVEQTNSFIKNFGIFDKMHWYDQRRLGTTVQVVCGLINFRNGERRAHPENWGHANRLRRKLVEKPKGLKLVPNVVRRRARKRKRKGTHANTTIVRFCGAPEGPSAGEAEPCLTPPSGPPPT